MFCVVILMKENVRLLEVIENLFTGQSCFETNTKAGLQNLTDTVVGHLGSYGTE